MGIALFVRRTFAEELATRMRACDSSELAVGDPPVVLETHGYTENGFFFNDDDALVITIASDTFAIVIARLDAGERRIQIGDEVRIELRD